VLQAIATSAVDEKMDSMREELRDTVRLQAAIPCPLAVSSKVEAKHAANPKRR
jgi:hypothetical protein